MSKTSKSNRVVINSLSLISEDSLILNYQTDEISSYHNKTEVKDRFDHCRLLFFSRAFQNWIGAGLDFYPSARFSN